MRAKSSKQRCPALCIFVVIVVTYLAVNFDVFLVSPTEERSMMRDQSIL